MVPLQVEKWHKLRSAAFYKLIDIGFFPAPTKDQLITGTVNAKTVRGYCRLRAADGMQIDSITSMAYNSMGLGAVIRLNGITFDQSISGGGGEFKSLFSVFPHPETNLLIIKDQLTIRKD